MKNSGIFENNCDGSEGKGKLSADIQEYQVTSQSPVMRRTNILSRTSGKNNWIIMICCKTLYDCCLNVLQHLRGPCIPSQFITDPSLK